MSDPATTSTPAISSAPIWRRLVALVYDLFLLTALSMAYGALAVLALVVTTGAQGEAYTPMFEGPLFPLGWALVLAGFYWFFWYRGGQTLGMRAWRLQLTNAGDNGRVSFSQCVIRSLVGPFALGLAGVGYWWRWFDRDRLCLHDRLSGTRVIVLPKVKD